MSPLPALAILTRYQDAMQANEQPSWASYMRSKAGARGYHTQLAAGLSKERLPAQQHGSGPNVSQRCDRSLQGRIWELAQEQQGSRQLQVVLDMASDQEVQTLTSELLAHIIEASKCRHANFVVQKCISVRNPGVCSAIAQEITRHGQHAVVNVAKNRYGCRIIQRLLEVCEESEMIAICRFMLDDAEPLCTHPYGNYTVQHMLSHGPNTVFLEFMAFLTQRASSIASNFHASAVYGEALRRATPDDAFALAMVLHNDQGLLSHMSRTKHGHAVVILVRQIVDPKRGGARSSSTSRNSADGPSAESLSERTMSDPSGLDATSAKQ